MLKKADRQLLRLLLLSQPLRYLFSLKICENPRNLRFHSFSCGLTALCSVAKKV